MILIVLRMNKKLSLRLKNTIRLSKSKINRILKGNSLSLLKDKLTGGGGQPRLNSNFCKVRKVQKTD
jgi:hypothetical protein